MALIPVLAVAEEKQDGSVRLARSPAWVQSAGVTAILFCMAVMGSTDCALRFVYFPF